MTLDVDDVARTLRDYCVGCGICISLCPSRALFIRVSNGLIHPVVEPDLCIKCGTCLEYCPGVNNIRESVSIETSNIGSTRGVFFSFSNNFKIRYNGASGGVVTSILRHLLESKIINEVLVTKMDGFYARPTLTGDIKEVEESQGSIYFKSFTLRKFTELLGALASGERIAVVGLPCQLSTLTRLLEKWRDRLFFIGLICNQVNEFWYLTYTIMKYVPREGRIYRMTPRGKGWPGNITIEYILKNQAYSSVIPLPVFWGCIPLTKVSAAFGCLSCCDHLALHADIVVGDAWHPKFIGKDSVGASIAVARTFKGLEVLREAEKANKITLLKASFQDLAVAHKNHMIEIALYASRRRAVITRKDSLPPLPLCEKLLLGIQVYLNNLIRNNSDRIMKYGVWKLIERILNILLLFQLIAQKKRILHLDKV